MNRYISLIIILLQSMAEYSQNESIKQEIQSVTNTKELSFYRTLLRKYFCCLPQSMTIHFSFDDNKSTKHNIGNIYINKLSKKIIISNDIFCIYNKGKKFFLEDKELNEINQIKKPEIIDLFLNNNIDSILKNAQLFKKNNRLSCKIHIHDSIGTSTIILSFNIINLNSDKYLELKFWNIKNEYMKNKTIKVIKIEKN